MRAAFAVAAVAALLALPGCASPGGPADASLEQALDGALGYLLEQRGPDGEWEPAFVPYVAEAATEAGKDLGTWPDGLPVAAQAGMPPADASFMASLRPLHAAALAAEGDEGRLSQVRDRVLAGFDGAQFGDPGLLNDDAFALIVLGAADADDGTWTDVEPAVRHLVEAQTASGGWSWAPEGEAEADMTGLVLHGLAQAGAVADRVDGGAVLAFVDSTRATGGGHSLRPGGEPNCDSTVWAIRALAELGVAAGDATWRFLLGLQTDAGGFAYTPDGPANDLCTAEAATLLGSLVHGRVPAPSGLDEPGG